MSEELVAPSVDDLAARLSEDPVVIDDRFGNGETAQAEAGLEELVAAADVPTYVVLAPAPSGLAGGDPAADLANQLQSRLGEDDATFAIYLAPETTLGPSRPEVVGFGDGPGDDEAFAAQMEHGPSGGGVDAGTSTVGVLARDLQAAIEGEQMSGDDWDAYASEQPWAERTDWEPAQEFPEPGSAALVVTLVAVVAAGLVLLLVHRVPTLVALHRGRVPQRDAADAADADGPPAYRSPRRSIRDADAPTVRASLDATLDELADDVAEHLGALDDEAVVTLVTGSHDTARRTADRAGRDHADLPDLLGALVLARIAQQSLDDARAGRPARPPYQVCLIDPRHGVAKGERELPVGDRTLTAPVCGECRQQRPEKLRPFRVAPGRFGGARPYLETDSVWARTGYGAFTDLLWRDVARELEEGTS